MPNEQEERASFRFAPDGEPQPELPATESAEEPQSAPVQSVGVEDSPYANPDMLYGK